MRESASSGESVASGEKRVEDDDVDNGKEKGEGDVAVRKERPDDMAISGWSMKGIREGEKAGKVMKGQMTKYNVTKDGSMAERKGSNMGS
ncbi:hypothetical protein QQP08_005588 [Theobroma cacao]|uniref:Uncharacterized protein n=1 Tax=Theobroma cacao TaxID=3641 RepID=A0A061FPT6_THECC|nr:Uncharacterized protein TCM_044388 [Theobroma cacao]WRX13101.1 hypothetical protein QQP08_005588 [Theobroma cacao]